MSSATPTPRSGRQIELRLGDQAATVTDVGAKLRTYTVGGRDVVTPFPADDVAPAGHGAVLAPWPNRIRDGQYTWDGLDHQLDLSEPERGTALHGLAMWVRWAEVDPASLDDAHRTGSAVTLQHRTAPGAGYPFDVLLHVTYRLTTEGPGGLHVQARATNLGQDAAPYGIGFHPWLSPGGAPLDDCTLRVDAATHVTVDDRLLPTGTEPVSGRFDLREERSARGVDLDDGFLDPVRDEAGRSWIRLGAPDGRTSAVWMDESMQAWQVCTGDHISAVDYRRSGVAAEPMTCIADAFRTGDLLVRLEPGESHEVTWGLALL